MKILILSRYDRRGASSRLRTMQYIPYLSGAGFDVEVASLFDFKKTRLEPLPPDLSVTPLIVDRESGERPHK